jgi:ribosome recycling factor|tara:strand:- start:51 stop:641 length:591 start_codon:yes stop_codon:yes gene_type:complete
MPEQDNNSTPSDPASVLGETERKMNSSITALKRELSAIRTGRATPALIENVPVDYYGVPTPLNQIASISAPDSRAIMVQPWDKQALQEIEKSLIKSDMGFNPSNDGTIITVPIPPLTQERRQELVRLLKRRLEESKVSIRNVRRDGIDSLRKLERAKSISQDENRRTQDQLQKSTDNHVKIVDDLGASKETEIMQV